MTRRSKSKLEEVRLERLRKNLESGKRNVHIKKPTYGAAELLEKYGRTDVFVPLPNRDQITNKKIRRHKQYERFLAKEAEIIRQEGLRYSELGRFMSSRNITRE